MWQKYLPPLALLVFLCFHNGHGQTFVVHLDSLLQMQQGIGWPLHLHVAEGNEALIRLSKTLMNQQSCEVTTPAGDKFDVRNPPSNRYESWGEFCGVRVKSVVASDEGRWRLTAKNGTGSLTGWSEVDVEKKISAYTPDIISLQDGQKSEVELVSLNNSYCVVAQPFSDSSLVPGHCQVTLDRTTRAVQGKWSMLLGLPGQVTELHVERNVAVESERLDVGYIRDTDSHKIHMYCNILHTAKNITFCRFQKTTENVGFNIADGLSDGRYSYYGDGFFKRQCGMTIEAATAEDYGTWRCTVGVQEWVGTTIQQKTPMQALISVSQQGGTTRFRRETTMSDKEVKTMFVEKDSSLTLTCQADASLAYCWFQHPNGSQFTPVERQVEGEQEFWYTGQNLQSGECGITFAHVSDQDDGTWTCHMGYLYQPGVEEIENVVVRVTGPLAANEREVGVSVGGTATLYCHTSNGPRPLDYCRFLSPKFMGLSLDSSVDADNAILNRFYFTPERTLDHGDCSLTINPVLEEDFGQWTCAAVLHDHTMESRDTISLYYMESASRMPRVQAGLIGTSVGILVLGLVLAGTMWYKKGRPLPWPRPAQRFSNGSDALSMAARTERTDSRASTSTASSSEVEIGTARN